MCHTVSIVDVNKIKTTQHNNCIILFMQSDMTLFLFSKLQWKRDVCGVPCNTDTALDDHLNKPKLIRLPSLNLNMSSELLRVNLFPLCCWRMFLSVLQCWRSSCSPRTQTQCFDLQAALHLIDHAWNIFSRSHLADSQCSTVILFLVN